MDVADLDLDAHGLGQVGNADPVEAMDVEDRRVELRLRADGDAAAVAVDVQDVERVGRGERRGPCAGRW